MNKSFSPLCCLCIFLFISACGGGGGGGGGGSSSSMPPVTPPVVIVPTPSSTNTIENLSAIDPLPAFKAVQLPTFNYFDYRKQADGIHLELNWYLNPNADLPNDLIPMVHRAFKVWSRRYRSSDL